MANPTTNLSMTKPTVGGSTDTWGTTLNEEVVDVIDAVFAIGGTDVTMSDIKFNSVGLQETGAGTDTIKIQAPSAVTQYTLTMPGAVGASGQILRTSDASGTLAWVTDEEGDLKSVADATNGGLDVTNGTGPDVTLAVDFNDLAAAVVDVAADSIGILDATDNDTKKETIADLVSAMGGTGLTGASGQLSVDAAQTQITSVGALDAGSITSGFGAIDNGSSAITTTGTVSATTLAGTLSTATQNSVTTATGLVTVGALNSGSIASGFGNINNGSSSITGGAASFTTISGSTSLALATGATVTGIDNGALGSSATLLATQGAVKTYVDAQVGSFDTLAEVLAAGNTTGSTDIVVTAGQKITTDTVSETTAAAGVTIDSVLLKDNTVTATTFTGALAGNASGTAATVTSGTQAAITTAANLVTVGALNSGSIASGFGTINTGSSAITGGAGSFTTISGSTSLALATGATVTGIDNATLATGSATLLATQGAIKTYVDAQVGAADSLSEVLANGNTTGSTNIIVSASQKITTDTIDETTAAAGVTIDSVLLKDNVVTATSLAGTLTTAAQTNITSVGALGGGSISSGFGAIDVGSSNIDGGTITADTALVGTLSTAAQGNITSLGTISSLVATTADINAGTFDGIVGGTTPADGSFTTLSASSTLAVGGAGTAYIQSLSSGAFISGGGSGHSFATYINTDLRGASGDTSQLALLYVQGSILTHATSETVTNVSTVSIAEPNITKGSGSTVTNATSLRIMGAPTEGGTNRALWVVGGLAEFDGEVEIAGNVGIGQSPGSNALMVTEADSGVYAASITHSHASNGYGVLITAGDDANVSALLVRNASASNLFSVDGAGNVAVTGTSTLAGKLQVADTGNTTVAGIGLNGTTNGFSLPTTNTMSIITNSVTAISIDGSQDVTMSSALAVTGTSAFTGNVGIGGSAAANNALITVNASSGNSAVDFTHSHATNPRGVDSRLRTQQPHRVVLPWWRFGAHPHHPLV